MDEVEQPANRLDLEAGFDALAKSMDALEALLFGASPPAARPKPILTSIKGGKATKKDDETNG